MEPKYITRLSIRMSKLLMLNAPFFKRSTFLEEKSVEKIDRQSPTQNEQSHIHKIDAIKDIKHL